MSDLRAQIAANACGMAELHKLVNDFGLETVGVYKCVCLAPVQMRVRHNAKVSLSSNYFFRVRSHFLLFDTSLSSLLLFLSMAYPLSIHCQVCAYMGHVQDNAEEAVRRVIDDLPVDKPLQFTYAMDNGEGHGKADGNPAISIKVRVFKIKMTKRGEKRMNGAKEEKNEKRDKYMSSLLLLFDANLK